ncbi:hypothetical protein [Deinococcus pimensis]|uniref:hypothetical protein n=1 Tax=Deinococcus pimensis TaxID=309888 RepID=UPI000488F97B|nr:hypothetical protein [Deinococcus pimensis]
MTDPIDRDENAGADTTTDRPDFERPKAPLDTTLGTARTGGMGGMAGTGSPSADTDMAGEPPGGDLEDQ